MNDDFKRNSIIRKQGININRLINEEEFKDFNDIIKCRICFQIIFSPVDCLCQHTFCSECLSNLKENNQLCPYQCDLNLLNFNKLS